MRSPSAIGPRKQDAYLNTKIQRWASLLKNVTSLSVTPLQKVTEVTVTPLLRYFYKIKSQKRRKGIDDAAATN